MKFYVECCKSKDKESTYHALKCDFGYRVAIVSMEKDLIAEMANITMAQLYDMKPETKVFIGEVKKNG